MLQVLCYKQTTVWNCIFYSAASLTLLITCLYSVARQYTIPREM